MPHHECQKEACAIQDCLTKTNFAHGKCDDAVLALYRCCSDLYRRAEKEGTSMEEAKSDSCPIPSVVERKLIQLEREKEERERKRI